MRLFLSSQGIAPHQKALLKLVGENRKTAFINNAKDDLDPTERAAHTQQKLADYAAYGLEPFEVDLRNFFTKKRPIGPILGEVGLVWLAGGNTFVLRRALAHSGMDKWLVQNVQTDRAVYGGSSAGAIIPTPSLRGAENESEDDPNSVPSGYDKEVIWEGLNLVPFHIVPHYESEWFGDEAAEMENYMKQHNLPYKALKDGQVVIINGDSEETLE